jgi:N-carbamoyl-L-amino-acid hydrolase
VQRLAAELQTCRVATVGSVQALPNAVNVIPGNVRLGLEFRDVSMEGLTAAEAALRRAAGEISDSDGVEIEIQRHRASRPVPIHPRMQALVEEAAGRCGLAHTSLPSGAGHDAQAMASITDAAMLFVPSVDGISHSPMEFSTPEDCANGAQALLELILLADERL